MVLHKSHGGDVRANANRTDSYASKSSFRTDYANKEKVVNATNLQAIEHGTEIVSSLLTKSTNNRRPGPTNFTFANN